MSPLDLPGKRGLVVGMTSRADTVLAPMASCAVALIAARRGERAPP